MDQVSRPLLIALVAVVGFAGVWMTVLRPRAAASGEASTGGAGGRRRRRSRRPGHPRPRPRGAGRQGRRRRRRRVGGQDRGGHRRRARREGSGEAASVRHRARAHPGREGAHDAGPRRRERPDAPSCCSPDGGADDAAARALVRSLHGPRLRTIVASLGDLDRYEHLIGGVAIDTLPTILVVGADRRAQRITGLPDRAQVLQALAAAR